jgi:hypothetical protein
MRGSSRLRHHERVTVRPSASHTSRAAFPGHAHASRNGSTHARCGAGATMQPAAGRRPGVRGRSDRPSTSSCQSTIRQPAPISPRSPRSSQPCRVDRPANGSRNRPMSPAVACGRRGRLIAGGQTAAASPAPRHAPSPPHRRPGQVDAGRPRRLRVAWVMPACPLSCHQPLPGRRPARRRRWYCGSPIRSPPHPSGPLLRRCGPALRVRLWYRRHSCPRRGTIALGSSVSRLPRGRCEARRGGGPHAIPASERPSSAETSRYDYRP